MVESTVEHSMLAKIAGQLSIAQNENESGKTGLSALFRTLSDHFVKVVLACAFATALVWSILLATKTTPLTE
jgi:cation transport ATPase